MNSCENLRLPMQGDHSKQHGKSYHNSIQKLYHGSKQSKLIQLNLHPSNLERFVLNSHFSILNKPTIHAPLHRYEIFCIQTFLHFVNWGSSNIISYYHFESKLNSFYSLFDLTFKLFYNKITSCFNMIQKENKQE